MQHVPLSHLEYLREIARLNLEKAREESRLHAQQRKRPRSSSPVRDSPKQVRTSPPTSTSYPNLEIPIPPQYPSLIPVPSKSPSPTPTYISSRTTIVIPSRSPLPVPIYIPSRSPSPPIF
jgi:hypothetical protein